MKHTAKLILFVVGLAFITSCKRDSDNDSLANKPPVARAGPDISVSLPLCTDKNGVCILDGTASSGTNLSYHWQFITSTRPGAALKNADSAIARVEDIRAGEYVFELTVRDGQGSISRDTATVSAKGPAKEYEFDISIITSFSYTENYEDYYSGYWDFTEINGKANFSSFGEFNVNVFEFADTSDIFDDHDTGIQIYTDHDKESLYGRCSVNFKKLINQGGGVIDGVLDIRGGSAQDCDQTVFNALPQLTVTGSLNLAAGTVDLRIKGKVYF